MLLIYLLAAVLVAATPVDLAKRNPGRVIRSLVTPGNESLEVHSYETPARPPVGTSLYLCASPK
jgi:hypothetical protein